MIKLKHALFAFLVLSLPLSMCAAIAGSVAVPLVSSMSASVVRCSDPGFVANSTRALPSNAFAYNTNVNYHCLKGFRMIGVPFLTCRADAKWNRDKPVCQLKRCPDLPPTLNGRIVYTDSERITDSKAEYICDQGFKLNTMHTTRYCRQDDTWSPLSDLQHTQPKCEMVSCENPVRPHLGIRILPQRVLNKPGDVIIYSCDTNKVIKASSKCLSDGSWTRGPPHCPPMETSCPPIGDFEFGTYNVTNSAVKDSPPYRTSTKIKFYCNDNYILDGSQVLTCLPSGVWNGSAPKCAFKEPLSQSPSSQLTILITSIIVILVLVLFAAIILFCRWKQQQMQRRRWQQYFGHYNHRQSKTNIMLNTNEMKCFRQTPPKPTVPVTDL